MFQDEEISIVSMEKQKTWKESEKCTQENGVSLKTFINESRLLMIT